MIEAIKRIKALAVLTEALQGNFISRFSIGDTFDLYIADYWLVAHNVLSPDEALLSKWYAANYSSFSSCVDKENISKATILAAHLRTTITEITMDDSCSLTLHFEDDTHLVISTDTDIVDWQWALNTSGSDPYMDHVVACFWAGEVSIAADEE